MEFTVTGRYGPMQNNSQCYLTWDDWNDYNYRTIYGLVYVDGRGMEHKMGGVRIARFGQEPGPAPLEKDYNFTQLGPEFFSLGGTEDYYEELNNLGPELRDEILTALNDIAKFPDIFDRAMEENVTTTSLLRYFTASTVTGQLRRMANGGYRLTSYQFGFAMQEPRDPDSGFFTFEVFPESFPPTNIHVLIGRNGVGKTHLLYNMISSLLNPFSNSFGKFTGIDENFNNDNQFANLVAVSFSAFDESIPVEGRQDGVGGLPYYYIGLRKPNDEQPKSTKELCKEFLASLNACKNPSLKKRWKDAIEMLESDTNFKDSEIKGLIEITVEEDYEAKGENIFRRLSSGHKIILLTITRLIEKVQEKTLVMIDEPEAHLHPPLLSAFIRAVADLLIKLNGVAIIATHSPVILQEVPKSCAWKMRRSGATMIPDRPGLETFGENVGVLTSDVFGLEVTNAGFYKLLAEQVAENKSYDDIIRHFNHQLGMEARAVLMALVANRDNSNFNA